MQDIGLKSAPVQTFAGLFASDGFLYDLPLFLLESTYNKFNTYKTHHYTNQQCRHI